MFFCLKWLIIKFVCCLYIVLLFVNHFTAVLFTYQSTNRYLYEYLPNRQLSEGILLHLLRTHQS